MAYANALDYYKGVTGQGEDSFLKLGSTGMDKWNNKYDSYLFNNGSSRGAKTRAQTNVTSNQNGVPGLAESTWKNAQQWLNKTLGTTYGNRGGLDIDTSKYFYTDNTGGQGTLDLSGVKEYLTPDVVGAINNPYGGTDVGLASKLGDVWDGIGGAKGFADLAGGLGALGSLYTGWQQNKMAEQEHDARMSELKRQRQRDADWQRDIKASGLGSYSAGMGGK